MIKVVSFFSVLVAFLFPLEAQEKVVPLPLYKETEHFRLYCVTSDQTASNQVLDVLEQNQERIARDFKEQLQEQVVVELHPNLKAFHKRIGCPECRDWVVGIHWKGGVYMVSPNNPGSTQTFDTMMQVAVHEMTHIFVAMKTQKAPPWLNEGIACYEAGQNPIIDRDYMVAVAKKQGIPKFDILEGDSNTFAYAGGYPFSYTLVEFIVKNWDFDAILTLLAQYDHFEEALGLTKEAFWDRWVDFVKLNYLDGK